LACRDVPLADTLAL